MSEGAPAGTPHHIDEERSDQLKDAVAKQFGANLLRIRRRANVSQEEVGLRTGLHRTAVGLLERGERVPRIDTVVKLAFAFEVPVAELVIGTAGEASADASPRPQST